MSCKGSLEKGRLKVRKSTTVCGISKSVTQSTPVRCSLASCTRKANDKIELLSQVVKFVPSIVTKPSRRVSQRERNQTRKSTKAKPRHGFFYCEAISGSTSQPCAKKMRAFFVRLSFVIE